MIDANQQRFWMLAEPRHFDLDAGGVDWDPARRVLRLGSARPTPDFPQDLERARQLANASIPVTFDAFDTWARTNDTRDRVLAGGAFADEAERRAIAQGDPFAEAREVYAPGGGAVVRDMAAGADAVLYVLVAPAENRAEVHLVSLRSARDASAVDPASVRRLPVAGGAPDRIVALPGGGALLLDRVSGRLWQVVGQPVRGGPSALYAPETPRPCADGPVQQRLVERGDLVVPARRALALASNPSGEVAVLLEAVGDGTAEVVLVRDAGVSAPVALAGARAPFTIGWVGRSRWAVMFEDRSPGDGSEGPARQEAIAFVIPFEEEPLPSAVPAAGHRYPVNRAHARLANQGFCNALSEPVRYSSVDRSGRYVLRPLGPLSLPGYTTSAAVEAKRRIDGGRHGAAWHRLYLEAHLPPGTGVTVWLRASDDPADAGDEGAWAPHRFGAGPREADTPGGTWLPDASEVPYHPGLLYCAPRRDAAGLFTALAQRGGRAVRRLSGRYLWIRVELSGNGHATPELAALRVYGPRFSYAREYLPELYAEAEHGDVADRAGPATGADFLERLLCLFEGVLTPLEDKIAGAHLLTNPRSAPADALEWLAQWVGMSLEEGFSEARKRDLIRNATRLYRSRGTLPGLQLALDIATDGWVRQGSIVLLEDFRLRRTFATILGADLSIEDDPLLAGEIPNANSFVGDTLFLGEESRQEFYALFASDVIEREGRADVVEGFVERLAGRLTVLVHEHTDEDQLALIRRVVTLETPAHIEFRIVRATRPLLVGLYSLVGVDTFLQAEPPRRRARVGHSYLGTLDFVHKLPVLDDRLVP